MIQGVPKRAKRVHTDDDEHPRECTYVKERLGESGDQGPTIGEGSTPESERRSAELRVFGWSSSSTCQFRWTKRCVKATRLEGRLGRYSCKGKRDGRLGSSGTANLHQPKIPLNDRVDKAKVRGAFINGQGIRRKVHEVGGILQNLDLDVIGIAETWLLPGERVEVDGYRWIGIPREGNVGRGGVGLFVRDGYEVEVIETGVEEEGGDEGMEVMWVRLRRKGLGDILIGVVYVTPQGLSKGMFKADQFVEFICDKRQQGEEILVMGDFNAHFDSGGKALDCRAKFLNRLNKVGGLRIMNFADFTRGKWTWQGREKQSVLDYILMSQELADSTSSMTIDDDGWFDIGSDHNLMFWESNDSYKMEQRSGEEASSLKGQCRDSFWAWKTEGKVDWAGYKIKVEEKMKSLRTECPCAENHDLCSTGGWVGSVLDPQIETDAIEW